MKRLALIHRAIALLVIGSMSTMAYSQKAISVPSINSYKTSTSFNQISQLLVDRNYDGQFDYSYVYEYYPSGQKKRYARDNDYDGQDDYVIGYFIDSKGQLIRTETDYDGDNVIDRIMIQERNKDGHDSISTSLDGKGKIIGISYYFYDENGAWNTIKTDDDGDKSINRIDSFVRNKSGLVLESYFDFENDGNWNQVVINAYDNMNRPLINKKDIDGDGNFEQVRNFTYDDINRTKLDEYDSDGDGNLNRIQKTYYNELDLVVQRESDWDADGQFDANELYFYVGEHLTSYRKDDGNDGIFEQGKYYGYDANGNRNQEYSVDLESGDTTYFSISDYDNNRICGGIGGAKVHILQVDILAKGDYKFSLCGSTFNTVMALGVNDACDQSVFLTSSGCTDGNAEKEVYLDKGTYYVTVGGKLNKDTGDYVISVEKVDKTNIKQIQPHGLSVYPNPVKDGLLSINNKEAGLCKMYDYLGKLVFEKTLEPKSTINAPHLVSGLYYITFQDKVGSMFSGKVLVE